MNFAMSHIRNFPLMWFLILNFGITWLVWLSVPSVMGSDWTQQKLMIAAGFGPAPAALVVSYAQGHTVAFNSKRWWYWFLSVFIILIAINSSSVVHGDGINAEAFIQSSPAMVDSKVAIMLFVSSFIVAFVVASVVCNSSRNLNSLAVLSTKKRYLLIALLLPMIWSLLSIATSILTDSPVTWINTGDLDSMVWLGYVIRSVLFTLFVVAIGEEVGWRGWLQPHLQEKFSPLLTTVLIGIVWGLWHWPLYVIGQYPGEPTLVFVKVGLCIFLGIFFTWLYNRSGGNLLLMVLLHTALNNTNRVLPMTPSAGAYLVLFIVIMIVVDKMWRRQGTGGAQLIAQE